MGSLYFPNEQMEDEFEGVTHKTKQFLLSLSRVVGWRTRHLYLFQEFWCQPKEIQAIVAAQSYFRAQDGDIIVATIPKSGTTWLKALVFAIVNRARFCTQSRDHPLLRFNPHDLVPFLEYKVYANHDENLPNLDNISSPRLFATHVPYKSLPKSITDISSSNCKIVYICRNPFDTFVSIWHFLKKIRPKTLGPFSMEEAFEMYCKGQVGYGPYWDHMLGFWDESLKMPQKVMFLMYEDLKENIELQVRNMARFLGFPFSAEEEKDGVVEDISKLCSFQNLKNLEVNKEGKSILNFDNKGLFRKGEVADWVNLLSREMVEKLGKIFEDKLAGSGLNVTQVLNGN